MIVRLSCDLEYPWPCAEGGDDDPADDPPGRPDEYDEIARIWMESWTSTGLTPRSDGLLNDLRARLPPRDRQWLEPVRRRRSRHHRRHAGAAPADLWCSTS